MNILIVSQYFWPESFIINDLSRVLRRLGANITVLTGKPNYPDGEIFKGYTQKYIQREYFYEGIEVLRVPLRPRGKKGAIKLFFNYFSFVFNGLKSSYGLVKGRDFDVILVFAPSPITMAIPAMWLKYRLNVPMAIWVQDLWPESLHATGYVRNSFILKLVGLMVKGIYAYADLLLVQSRAFFEPVGRYTNINKLVYYPNSSVDLLQGDIKGGSLPQELTNLLDNKFCMVFAGNLGTAQSLDTIIEAARLCKDLQNVMFVFVGSGSRLEWLEDKVKEYELNNVVVAGRFPSCEMPIIFSKAKALIASLKQEEIFSFTVPSKIQSYLSSGTPIIAALDGEGAKVINEAGGGLTCQAEDSKGLVGIIREFYSMSNVEREEMGASGRRYYLENFEMNKQAEKLIEILSERFNGKISL